MNFGFLIFQFSVLDLELFCFWCPFEMLKKHIIMGNHYKSYAVVQTVEVQIPMGDLKLYHLQCVAQITRRIFRVNLIMNFNFSVNWSDQHTTT